MLDLSKLKDCVCSTSMSNFSFSHSVFCSFTEPSVLAIKFEIVVCKLPQFGIVLNLSFGKGLSLINLLSCNTINLDTSELLSSGKDKIVNWSKFKAQEDNKINMTENLNFV